MRTNTPKYIGYCSVLSFSTILIMTSVFVLQTQVAVGSSSGPSPCYFDPSLDVCKTVNGKCPEGLRFTDSDQCVPIGKCPDGYGRLDDDESGKCHNNSDIKVCPDEYITHKDDECPS